MTKKTVPANSRPGILIVIGKRVLWDVPDVLDWIAANNEDLVNNDPIPPHVHSHISMVVANARLHWSLGARATVAMEIMQLGAVLGEERFRELCNRQQKKRARMRAIGVRNARTLADRWHRFLELDKKLKRLTDQGMKKSHAFQRAGIAKSTYYADLKKLLGSSRYRTRLKKTHPELF